MGLFLQTSLLLHTLCAVTVGAAVLVAFAGGSAVAKKKIKAPATCVGIDMLGELRDTDQNAYNAILSEAARTKNSNALLWRVTKNGGAASYLFGTIHLSDPRVTTLSPAVSDALSKAKVVALEVEDLSQSATSAAIAEAVDLVVFSDDQSLSTLLSKEEFDVVSARLTKMGLGGQMASLFKPWVVSLLTAVSDCERARVSSGKRVLDMVIAHKARDLGVPVVGLETLKLQLETAASIPLDEQLYTLRTGIHYSKRADDLMETLISLYINRQMGAALPFQKHLARAAGTKNGSFEGFQRELVEKRNRKMRTHMLPLLGKGNAFVAVGAMHLIGDEGIVALLRKSGFDVTPVE